MGLLCACGRLRCLTPSALVFKDVEAASWFVGEAAVDPEWSKFLKINKIKVVDLWHSYKIYHRVLKKLLALMFCHKF